MNETVFVDPQRGRLPTRAMLTLAFLIAGGIAASPALAAEQTPREIFEAALAGEPFDEAAFDEAVARTAAAGEAVTLGLYDDGPVAPLAAPLTISIPETFAYGCDNKTFAMGLPESSFPDSREEYRVRDEGGGSKLVSLATTDPDGTIRLIFRSDGRTVRLERLAGNLGPSSFDVSRVPGSGGFADALSSDTFTDTSPEIVLFSQVAEAAAVAHPFWFADGRRLEPGDPFMQDALRGSIAPLVGAMTGTSGAGFEIGFLASVLSGEVTIDGVRYLVFEGGFTATATVEGGAYGFSSTFAELYDVETFVPSETTQQLDLSVGDRALRISNFLRCAPL